MRFVKIVYGWVSSEYASDVLEKKKQTSKAPKFFLNLTNEAQSNWNKFPIKLHLPNNIC